LVFWEGLSDVEILIFEHKYEDFEGFDVLVFTILLLRLSYSYYITYTKKILHKSG